VLAIDVLAAAVAVVLPFTVPGDPILHVGSLVASREGAVQAAAIVLKATAIMLAVLALLSTLDGAALGRGLQALGLPQRLVQLLLLTDRYLDVLHREYARLRRAMTARAFRPRSDRHTWRSYAYLIGMLLVRSFERAERVLAAMKCRGYRGSFPVSPAGRLRPGDAGFAALVLTLLGLIVWIDRT
jgi:cobalt/nickel transport system permease protein